MSRVGWHLSVAVVERERILRGWTRDALARAAKIDEKTVRDALNARRRPTLGTVQRIARALDVELADVVVISEAVAPRARPSASTPRARLPHRRPPQPEQLRLAG